MGDEEEPGFPSNEEQMARMDLDVLRNEVSDQRAKLRKGEAALRDLQTRFDAISGSREGYRRDNEELRRRAEFAERALTERAPGRREEWLRIYTAVVASVAAVGGGTGSFAIEIATKCAEGLLGPLPEPEP